MRTAALVVASAALLVASKPIEGADPVPTPTPASAKTSTKELGAAPAPVAPAQDLGGAAGKIKLNRGVSFDQGAAPVLPTPDPKAKSKTGSSPTPKPYDSAEEARWRDRANAVRKDVAYWENLAKESQREFEEIAERVRSGRSADLQLDTYRYDRARADVSRYKAKAETERSRMVGLEEDCRKSGCMPGWLR